MSLEKGEEKDVESIRFYDLGLARPSHLEYGARYRRS